MEVVRVEEKAGAVFRGEGGGEEQVIAATKQVVAVTERWS